MVSRRDPKREVVWIGAERARKDVSHLYHAAVGFHLPQFVAGSILKSAEIELAVEDDEVLRLGVTDRMERPRVTTWIDVGGLHHAAVGFHLPQLEAGCTVVGREVELVVEGGEALRATSRLPGLMSAARTTLPSAFTFHSSLPAVPSVAVK